MSECAQCNEKCNTEARTPRLLPCGHTFCLPCLQVALVVGESGLTCALCKAVAALPAEGVAGFPVSAQHSLSDEHQSAKRFKAAEQSGPETEDTPETGDAAALDGSCQPMLSNAVDAKAPGLELGNAVETATAMEATDSDAEPRNANVGLGAASPTAAPEPVSTEPVSTEPLSTEMESFAALGAADATCEACRHEFEETVAATHSCDDCAQTLCTACSTLHGKKKASKGHRVRGLAGVVCAEHEDCRLEYYCSSHAKPVCLRCSHETHRACNVEKLQVVFARRRAELLDFAAQERTRANEMEQAAQRAGDEARVVTNEGTQALQETDDMFSRLHAALQRRQQAVQAEVRALVERKTRALGTQEAQLREAAATLQGEAQRLQGLVEGIRAAGALGLAGDLGRMKADVACELGLVEQRGVGVGWEGVGTGVEQLVQRLGTVVDMSSVWPAACTMVWEQGKDQGKRVVVGEEAMGVITARDRAGAALRRGGHDVAAQLVVQRLSTAAGEAPETPSQTACVVEDRGDGTYGARVQAGMAGDYTLVASCRGSALTATLRLAVRPPGPVMWGGSGSGQGQFTNPYGIAVGPDGLMYVVDWGNERVQVFRSDGSFVLKWGSRGSGQGQLSRPRGIAVDAECLVYVAEYGNHRVQVFRSDGSFVRTWGSEGPVKSKFKHPLGIAIGPDGLVYVTDFGNHRVQVFRSDGSFVRMWGSKGKVQGQFSDPSGIAVGPDGTVYVADSGNHRVQVFRSDVSFVCMWGSYGSGQGQFSNPEGIAVGPLGLVYVADHGNHRVQVFRSNGSFVRMWGSYGSSQGHLNSPAGIVAGPEDVLYVTEWKNHRVQTFPASSGAV